MLWLIQNWKTVLLGGALVALMATGVALYQKGAEHARLAAEAADLRSSLDFYKAEQARQAAALEADQKRAAEDAKSLQSLNQRITSLNEYVETLEDRDSTCLAGPDVDRLRDLWN